MYERILVPVDGSPTSNQGLAEAIKLAKLTGARLLLLHAVDVGTVARVPKAASADLIDAMRKGGAQILAGAKHAAESAGITTESVLLDTLAGRIGDPVVEHVREWHADLVVVGTHGRRGLGRLLLGSDAEHIARTAPVPVLLVRAVDAAGKAA